jgi:hypothetical protein
VRKLLIALAVAAALGASPAWSAPVQTGAQLELTFEGLGSVAVSGSGTVSLSGSTVVVGAGLVFLPYATIDLSGWPPSFPLYTRMEFHGLANQTGTFSLGGITQQLPGEVCSGASAGQACNAGGSVGGAMGITGTFYFLPAEFPIPIHLGTVGLGQGGTATMPFTVDNAGWTTGSAFVRTANATAGSVQQTVHGGTGPLQLVTATYAGILGQEVPVTATLTLTDVYLPEPETLLLLAAGAVGAAWVGRRRG